MLKDQGTMTFAPPDTQQQLRRFSPADGAIAELSAEYLPLRIDGPDDTVGYAVVHRARMDIRARRTSIEKLRKELKADALSYGRTVDTEAKRLTALLAPIEAHLLAEEKAVDDEKERIRNEKRLKEEAIIKAKEEAEAAEAKRVADAEAARVKAEQDAENERLRVEREKLEAEQQKQREAQEKLDAQQRVIEAEKKRLADIEAERIRAEEMEKAKAEAAEQARKDTEARIAKEEEEAEAQARAEEDARLRAESLRPDKEKLERVAIAVGDIVVPHLSPDATQAAIEVGQLLDECRAGIRAIAKGLS
jgi:DNA repair exonuclease SbcCD ATPase subunit